MRFPWHLEKGLRSQREYVEERMEVRSLKEIKRSLRLYPGDHIPITALQSSSERSNLQRCQSTSGGRLLIRYIRSRELDTIRKRRSECVGCLNDVSPMGCFAMSERTAQSTASTCGRYSCA
jgi:hypothetical protein